MKDLTTLSLQARSELLQILNESKMSMLAGIQELISSNVPEPIFNMNKLIADLSQMYSRFSKLKSKKTKKNKTKKKMELNRHYEPHSLAIQDTTLRNVSFGKEVTRQTMESIVNQN